MNMKKIYTFFIKTLLCIILFLVVAILCKRNVQFQKQVQDKVYGECLSFSYFKDFYNRYLGGIFPIENISNNQTAQVFYEDLVYDKVTSYNEGVALTVKNYYLVPVIRSGIVVYIGEKENYGNVVIIEGDDGIDVWYGNMCNVNVKLYDSLTVGSYLGEVCNDTLYLVFSNGNQFLNYKEYLE